MSQIREKEPIQMKKLSKEEKKREKKERIRDAFNQLMQTLAKTRKEIDKIAPEFRLGNYTQTEHFFISKEKNAEGSYDVFRKQSATIEIPANEKERRELFQKKLKELYDSMPATREALKKALNK